MFYVIFIVWLLSGRMSNKDVGINSIENESMYNILRTNTTAITASSSYAPDLVKWGLTTISAAYIAGLQQLYQCGYDDP